MTNKKGIKRSLLMSALALLLCVSMLIGSTFAWFTDSVTSVGNIIKSGKLEVTMEWKDATATGAQKTYKDASEGAIFNYDKWEPGYVEAKNVKISNVGTLALKYQLNILPNGEVSKLADVIDVYFAEGEIPLANREMTALKRVGTLREVLAGMPANMSGDLEAEKNDTVTIALKMREDAGNKYQGMSIDSEFAIQLLATQLTAEEDSFGPDYDEDAALGTHIELAAGADLLAAMASAKKDMPLTIKLNGNVEWPTEGHHGENDVTPASSILIDGNGYTITATGAGVTPLGDNNAPMTLKNVKIIDNSESYNESAWELSYCELGGVINCVNVDFVDAVMVEGTFASFVDCSFVGHKDKITGTTQYAVWVSNGDAIFTNCTFSGTRGLKAHEEYGSEISAVIVKDCVFSNLTEKPGIALGTLNADTTVSITGSTFINCQAGDQDLYIYESDTDVAKFNFKVENNTVLNGNEVAEGLFVNPASEENDWFVLNAAGLAELNAKMVNKTAGKNAVVNLISDIDFAGKTWITVDSHADTAFSLKEINGNGHTISNLTVNGQAMFSRFSGVGDVVIKDVTFENANINSNGSINTAILTGHTYQNVLLDNVDVKNSTITGGYKVAPLIGTVYNEKESTVTATLKNCDVDNVVVTATSYDFCTTGMVAFVYADNNDKIEFENCTVSNVKLYAPNVYTAHAAIYTTGSETLFNEAEGVVVTNVSFENK